MFLEYLNNNNIKNYNLVDYKLIRDYISYLYGLDYNNKTISRNISTLKSFFKFLKKNGIVEDNPCTLISNPKIEKKLPKFLNFEEISKLLNAFNTNNEEEIESALVLELLYSTGMRVSEICNIKINDISLSDKTIKVSGKGNKERIVYFGAICLNLIELYLEKRYNVVNKYNLDYFLIGKTGKKMNDRTIRKIVDDAAKKVDLGKKISPHVLRHTFATHMLQEGSNLRNVQELLGHKNLSTTQIYTHLTNEKIRSVYLNTHPRARR